MKDKKKTGAESAWKQIDRMVDERIKSGKKGKEAGFIARWKAAVKEASARGI